VLPPFDIGLGKLEFVGPHASVIPPDAAPVPFRANEKLPAFEFTVPTADSAARIDGVKVMLKVVEDPGAIETLDPCGPKSAALVPLMENGVLASRMTVELPTFLTVKVTGLEGAYSASDPKLYPLPVVIIVDPWRI